ncbi:hypothetical protein ACH5RR_041687 [Cinchona calisaya]|uniref:FACT complex subunit SSRP1 n=1 Tax=Cinchona calisaya TaxID=153742 RepID=A0ABD2XZM9_9GENT
MDLFDFVRVFDETLEKIEEDIWADDDYRETVEVIKDKNGAEQVLLQNPRGASARASFKPPTAAGGGITICFPQGDSLDFDGHLTIISRMRNINCKLFGFSFAYHTYFLTSDVRPVPSYKDANSSSSKIHSVQFYFNSSISAKNFKKELITFYLL